MISFRGKYSKKKGKYGAQKVSYGGYSFSSKLEAATYQILKLRMVAGEIKSIDCQVCVYLTKARVLYIPDFKCELTDGQIIYVESKGFEAARWPTIKKLWLWYGPAPLEIYKGNYDRPFLAETIYPKQHGGD